MTLESKDTLAATSKNPSWNSKELWVNINGPGKNPHFGSQNGHMKGRSSKKRLRNDFLKETESESYEENNFLTSLQQDSSLNYDLRPVFNQKPFDIE